MTVNYAALDRLLYDPTGPVGEYVDDLGDDVLRRARQLCPVLTGDLRRSLRLQPATRGATGPSGAVVAGSDHAIYVEMGTRRMRAEPFLRPALEAVRR